MWRVRKAEVKFDLWLGQPVNHGTINLDREHASHHPSACVGGVCPERRDL